MRLLRKESMTNGRSKIGDTAMWLGAPYFATCTLGLTLAETSFAEHSMRLIDCALRADPLGVQLFSKKRSNRRLDGSGVIPLSTKRLGPDFLARGEVLGRRADGKATAAP